MNRNWAAHEVLETNELLRKLTADIELHAICAEMTTDEELRQILKRQIGAMDQTYHQATNLLQHKGVNMTTTNVYQMHASHHPHVGFENPHMIPAPHVNARRLSDITIATLILNSHKAGSMFGMQWANECVDPDLRALHTMSANNCQQMAYEVWQHMNARGYYETPAMPMGTVTTVAQTFQPPVTGTTYNEQPLGEAHYTGIRHLI